MKKITVRINKLENSVDEVFLYREEPYVNRVVYTKPGIFTVGEVTDEEAVDLEQSSKDQLAKERADKLAAEEAERKKVAEVPQKPKAAKENK
jgi:hypothetical protein